MFPREPIKKRNGTGQAKRIRSQEDAEKSRLVEKHEEEEENLSSIFSVGEHLDEPASSSSSGQVDDDEFEKEEMLEARKELAESEQEKLGKKPMDSDDGALVKAAHSDSDDDEEDEDEKVEEEEEKPKEKSKKKDEDDDSDSEDDSEDEEEEEEEEDDKRLEDLSDSDSEDEDDDGGSSTTGPQKKSSRAVRALKRRGNHEDEGSSTTGIHADSSASAHRVAHVSAPVVVPVPGPVPVPVQPVAQAPVLRVRTPMALGLNNIADALRGRADDRSEAFLQLQEALEAAKDIFDDIGAGSISLDDASYELFQAAYIAADRFLQENRSKNKGAAKERLDDVDKLLNGMDYVTVELANANHIDLAEKNIPASKEEKDFAYKNIKRFTAAFFVYCSRIDQELITTDDEKLVKKWNAIKTCERDILIYFQNNVITDLPADERLLLREYRCLKRQMAVRNLMKKDNEEKETFGNESLSKEQLEGLSRIDTWVIRNIRNGGWFKMFGSRSISDRTDIAGKLMAMSKRERLFAYYLVEKKERITPDQSGLAFSQIDYVPNVKAFKEAIIASKAKFYLRFSGSYIYWNKLTEAMAIASRSKPILKASEEFFGYNEDGSQKQITAAQAQPKDMSNMSPKEQFHEHLRLMLINARQTYDILKRIEGRKNGNGRYLHQNSADQAALDRLKTEAQTHMHAIEHTAQDLREYKGSTGRAVSKEDVNSMAGEPSEYLSSLTTGANPALWDDLVYWKKSEIIDFAGNESVLDRVFYGGAGGLEAVGGLITSIIATMQLYEERKSISTIDLLSKSTAIASTIEKAVRGAADVVAMTTYAGTAVNEVARVVASPFLGVVVAGADTAVAVFKGASEIRDSYYRGKAAQLARQKGGKDKYREGMLKLNEKLAKRQHASTVSSGITAACSVTASALVIASVATFGLTLIPALIAVGVGIGAKAFDRKYAKEMKFALFDGYYEIDEMLDAEKQKYNRAHPFRPLTKDQEERMKEQLRGKVAAANGYYSPGHAAKEISVLYARYLRDSVQNNDGNADMCEAMIKGLGLKCKVDSVDPNNTIPTVSDIVRKLVC